MEIKRVILIGAPMDAGKTRQGCRMGTDVLRGAGLECALAEIGHDVVDIGNIEPDAVNIQQHEHLAFLPECVGWIQSLIRAGRQATSQGMPVSLGGDHAISMGSVAGIAAHAKVQNHPLFVLWLDAHSDLRAPQSTERGNLHGMPVACFTGQPGFDGFPLIGYGTKGSNGRPLRQPRLQR